MASKTYHGRPCKAGHTLRYRSDYKCVECKRAASKTPARRAYNREHRRKWRLDPENRKRDNAASKKQHAALRADPVKRARLNAQCNERNYFKKYGVTRKEKYDMLAAQGNACAACGDTTPKTFHPWHLDHDHETGEVRGILCQHCNLAVGNVKDDPAIADAIAAYLRNYK